METKAEGTDVVQSVSCRNCRFVVKDVISMTCSTHSVRLPSLGRDLLCSRHAAIIEGIEAVAADALAMDPGLLYQFLGEIRLPVRPLARWSELQWQLVGAELSVGRDEPTTHCPSRLRVRHAAPIVLEGGLWLAVLEDRVRFVREFDDAELHQPVNEPRLDSATLVADAGSESLARWLERHKADEFQAAYANSIGRLTGKKSGFPVLLHVGPGGESSIEPDRYLLDIVLGFDRV